MNDDGANRAMTKAEIDMCRRRAARIIAACNGYDHLRCTRCGEEVVSRAGVVQEELAHAIKGCNGSLYEIPL